MTSPQLTSDLETKVKGVIEEIVNSHYASEDIFDEICNKIDTWAETKGYQAYIRIYWNNESDFDQYLDDMCEIMDMYNIKAYCNYPCAEYECCVTVMLYKHRRIIHNVKKQS